MKSTKKDPGRWIRLRIVLVGVSFCSVMLLFVGRAVQLHLLKGVLLAQKASDQYEKRDKRFAKRGIIYDRNYEELAASVDDRIMKYMTVLIDNEFDPASMEEDTKSDSAEEEVKSDSAPDVPDDSEVSEKEESASIDANSEEGA